VAVVDPEAATATRGTARQWVARSRACVHPWGSGHLRRPPCPRRAAPSPGRAGRSQAGGQAAAHCWHRGRPPAPSAWLTRRDQATPPAPDLVGRQFTTERPNALWVADITYVPTWSGWLYLGVVLDCCSRRIVGWSMADHLRTELVLDALAMAIQRQPAPGLVHHADHGCQYTSLAAGG
jgi:putative transposase